MASSTTQKIALVTGGNRGLGRDAALSLARMGMEVLLTFNTNRDEGEAVAEEIRGLGGRAAALRLDLSDYAALDGFIAALRDVIATAHTDPQSILDAPIHTAVKRIDETRAAREPNLRWRPPAA